MNLHEYLSVLAFSLIGTIIGIGTTWALYLGGLLPFAVVVGGSTLIASIGILFSIISFFRIRDYIRFYEEEE